ncbi:MAG: hypothetical protein V7731_16005 [Amphritea sp.]
MGNFWYEDPHWPDGSRIRVFVLPTEHPTHRSFSIDTLNTYPYQLERAWKRLTFSGTGRAPMQLDSEQEMIKTVHSTPGSIGYISTATSKGESHVVEIQ